MACAMSGLLLGRDILDVFCRWELITSSSGAKNGVESASDGGFGVASSKPHKNAEIETKLDFCFSDIKN